MYPGVLQQVKIIPNFNRLIPLLMPRNSTAKWFLNVAMTLLLGALLFACVFFLLQYWETTENHVSDFNLEGRAEFRNKYWSPVVGAMGAALAAAAIFLQIWVNYRQDRQQSIDRFEKIFFELVHIHRENIRDLEIQLEDAHRHVLRGNKAIKALLVEIEVSYHFLKACKDSRQDHGLQGHGYFDLAGLAFLLCVEGHFKTRGGQWAVSDLNVPGHPTLDAEQAESLMAHLHTYLDHFFHLNLSQLPPATAAIFADAQARYPAYPDGALIPATAGYRPGQGFRDQVSTYFRHLFHTLKYLDDEQQLTAAQKRAYAGMLRAHISDEAQALLYYNSLSIWGRSWWGETSEGGAPSYPGMIMQHELLRNVPLDQIDPMISPLQRATEWFQRNRNISRPSCDQLKPYFHYLEDPRYYEWAFPADQTPLA